MVEALTTEEKSPPGLVHGEPLEPMRLFQVTSFGPAGLPPRSAPLPSAQDAVRRFKSNIEGTGETGGLSLTVRLRETELMIAPAGTEPAISNSNKPRHTPP